MDLNDNIHWYKDAVIYELHIKAFRDSNANGIGDFNGLIEKLDYLQDLGVTAIWLLPFYPSPLKDDGYDIADYYSINPAYGDMKQFKKLLHEAHSRNLKVITELVINHTSDQHPWFQRARNAPKDSEERAYYVWTDNPHQYRDVRIIFQDFEASNWTWDPVARQYYWHRFFHHQPDLNYDNPLVQKEIFKIIDYWCDLGVDGFRLDAVPYLFEREGTNCENLPETHAFLKKLRKYVDKNYPGTLLLAEANMWPEDSAAYFGNGDECHMNYHFPIMPRMFMALQQEDRYPITDIFDQTPAIPDTCQWAIFLRNHDELTLEMVTDEERDYMYKVYTKDPKAKINLGIRHRLAPLVGNNRKKIELLNYLLFSLPGTPVIYYGDEIGMGDNFYLGDRDGVRTPMQWSADRNAGFSECDAYRLYLPVIVDSEYHYEALNVDAQRKNSSSLLWWMKRVIHIRKNYPAFSRGDMQFIITENPKILCFTRTYQDTTLLVVANLSRYTQPVWLELDAYNDRVPVELFSKNKFPVIRQGEPYFLGVAAYDCHWFLLSERHPETDKKEPLPMLEIKKWKNILDKRPLEELTGSILPSYFAGMRWFGGKNRPVQSFRVADATVIPAEDNDYYLLLVEVTYREGLPEMYQLCIGCSSGDAAEKLKSEHPQSVLSSVKINGGDGILYDAFYSHGFRLEILRRMAGNHSLKAGDGELIFYGNKQLKKYSVESDPVKTRILSAEQSNTSIMYGNAFFLKMYRKVDYAISPDLEITRFLTEKAGFKHIPAFTGAIEWEHEGRSMVLGMMQEVIQGSTDGWVYMLERSKQFNEKILSGQKITVDLMGGFTAPFAYNELPAETRDLLEATVVDHIRLLGQRTAEMHLALASGTSNDFRPEPFSLHYQRSLYSSFQSLVRSTFQNLSSAMENFPDNVKQEAEAVFGMKANILHVMKKIYEQKFDIIKIRIHGDYHLGQVLFTGKDFIIIDFEGEPARSYSERRLKRSPLRDVAGMIRSFHYVAFGGLILNDHVRKEDREKLMPSAAQWYNYMSRAYVQSYLEHARNSEFIPSSPDDLALLLDIFLLEKAIYELNYELNSRPDWVLIPLQGIRSIMEKYTDNPE